jgi:hypothetical protein
MGKRAWNYLYHITHVAAMPAAPPVRAIAFEHFGLKDTMDTGIFNPKSAIQNPKSFAAPQMQLPRAARHHAAGHSDRTNFPS